MLQDLIRPTLPYEYPEWLVVRRVSYLDHNDQEGLFTLVNAEADQIVCEIPGRVIVDPDYVSATCYQYGDRCAVIEPFPPLDKLNHCCHPNCFVDTATVDGFEVLCLYALTDLKPGQELTIDYDWRCDPEMKCLCGHAKCRGVI